MTENERPDEQDTKRSAIPDSETVSPLPERIGPYRILDVLGEGGMGVVYLAEQTKPVRRQVALKVMRHVMTQPLAVIRFDAERQALARLQHPNVAQMYEAGTTEDGHLYFAMEPVDGQPIGKYCDQYRLSIQERLELFCAVCAGVQHAHQKGILHRDLKPSNILVTEVQGGPVPKIIDFGVAKALDQPLVDATLYTDDRLVGTPAYLSPEALGSNEKDADIDTRSDVYSLGIVLYELLVGVRPFDTRGLGFLQVLTKVLEDEPEGPSTRWTTLDIETRQAIADRRRLERSALKKRLRGDLDWIVMKAIAKDRRLRYRSPSELAADLRRHLEHRPVEAGPPSRFYRLGKLVRRHRALVAAALVVVLAGGEIRHRPQPGAAADTGSPGSGGAGQSRGRARLPIPGGRLRGCRPRSGSW